MKEGKEKGNLEGERSFRQPIVAVLGHVDSGKTTLLDYVRKTRVTAKEPGSITQHIGASEIPSDVLKRMCAPVFSYLETGFDLKTGGLLFIDLPGHEVFANLRRRGGSVADIAVLVVEIFGGIQPQTIESLNILRARKTPFLVSINKMDALSGWRTKEGSPFVDAMKQQTPYVQSELERRLYAIADQFAALGFEAERFDRVEDFTKTLAMVPTSALTGEGVPDLLAVLIGLVHRYMLDRLKLSTDLGKGTVLEVKEEPGLGRVITAIIYDGTIRKNDDIVVGGLAEPISTSVRALLRPRPMEEIRAAPRSRFWSVGEAGAASGIMIAAPGLEDSVSGSPLIVVRDPSELGAAMDVVRGEMERIMIRTEGLGIMVKADTLGSLEAIVKQLETKEIPIRRADIGDVAKKDVFEAKIVGAEEEQYGLILAFNVKVPARIKREAKEGGVEVIQDDVVYRLLENLDAHLVLTKEREKERIVSSQVFPSEIYVMSDHVFRRSKPAVVGVRIIRGRVRPSTYLMDDRGKRVGLVREIQDQGIRRPEASEGDEVAISIRGGVVGRNIHEGRSLYTEVEPIYDKKTKDVFFSVLSEEEKELYLDILKIRSGS